MADVSFDGARVHPADAAGVSAGGNWTDLGGGKCATEPDFVYQGTNAVSEKVGTTEQGVALDMTATVDYSTTVRVWIVKHIATNSAALNNKGATGGILEIGSGGIRADYARYYVVGGDTYPIKGGWLITPLDPNATPSATPGTSPTLTAIDYYGWACDFGATSKAENVACDAVDYVDLGTGLTLTGGYSPAIIGVFQDFIDADEGDITNGRWGVVSTIEGVLYVTGVLTIGSATETDFDDTGQVLVFPDAEFISAAGFFGLDIGLQNAASSIQIADCVFKGRGTSGGSADTRPDYGCTGTSGSGTYSGCTFDNFRNFEMTSALTLSSCSILNGLQLTQNGGTITDCTVSGATTTDGTAFIVSDDLGLISDCSFTFSDGHAIEINTAGSYDFDGNVFTGYGADESTDAAIYNTSGGLVTISVLNAASPTVRNESPSTVSVLNSVTLTVTVVDSGGDPIIGARVAIYTDPAGVELMNELTVSPSGSATESFNFVSDQAITIRVRESPNQAFGRYVPFFGTGTIEDTGFSLTVRLQDDDIAQVT